MASAEGLLRAVFCLGASGASGRAGAPERARYRAERWQPRRDSRAGRRPQPRTPDSAGGTPWCPALPGVPALVAGGPGFWRLRVGVPSGPSQPRGLASCSFLSGPSGPRGGDSADRVLPHSPCRTRTVPAGAVRPAARLSGGTAWSYRDTTRVVFHRLTSSDG
jgi:hypothetical protein